MKDRPISLSRSPVDHISRRLSRRDVVRGIGVGFAGAVAGRPLAAAAQGSESLPAPPTIPPAMIVAPNPVAVDEPFNVRLSGLRPGRRVTVRATVRDVNFLEWVSAVTVTADARGKVDLAKQVPISGSYHVADATGLIWAALPPGSNQHNARPFGYSDTWVPFPWTVTAEIDDDVVASAQLAREFWTPAISFSTLEVEGMYGVLCQPANATAAPAVLVLGGSEGGLDLVSVAILLARHGFAALNLAYFHYADLPPQLVNIPLEYFGKAIAWLQAQPGVRGDRLAVVGWSRGGELALLLGATYPELKAVVSYVGSGMVVGSPTHHNEAAWAYHGKPVPFVPFNWDENWLTVPRAAISVERINGPVMLIGADADNLWPSAFLLLLAWDRLRHFTTRTRTSFTITWMPGMRSSRPIGRLRSISTNSAAPPRARLSPMKIRGRG